MVMSSCEADVVSYNTVLKACALGAAWRVALQVLEDLSRRFGLERRRFSLFQ